MEQERREAARLREEFREYTKWAHEELANLGEVLARAKEGEAIAQSQALEASERAWEYSLKLDALWPAVLMRALLQKNQRTIQRLRFELWVLRGVTANARGERIDFGGAREVWWERS